MDSKRNRTIKKQIWLNADEKLKLSTLAKEIGKNESYVIRSLISGCQLKEKPDDRFYDLIKVLRKTSHNMNQIAAKAHSLGFIDELAYKKEVDKLDLFIDELKEKFIRNNGSDKK